MRMAVVLKPIETSEELEAALTYAKESDQLCVVKFSEEKNGALQGGGKPPPAKDAFGDLVDRYPDVNWISVSGSGAQELVKDQRVRRMPTYKLFVAGIEYDKVVGVGPQSLQKLESAILSAEIPVNSLSDGISASISIFGTTKFGQRVHLIRFSNGNGLDCAFLSYGAGLQSCRFPSKTNISEELTLGYESMAAAESQEQYYFSGTSGRVTGTIPQGIFSLDGEVHELDLNDGDHHSHGGFQGFDKQVWDFEVYSGEDAPPDNPHDPVSPAATKRGASCELDAEGVTWGAGGAGGVRFRRASLNGEQGYPGSLAVEVDYTVFSTNCLRVRHRARCARGAGPVDLSNHFLWNLSGGFGEPVGKHELWVRAARYWPALGVAGEAAGAAAPAPVAGTPLNFQLPVALRWRLAKLPRGRLDHCFEVEGAEAHLLTLGGEGGGGGGDDPGAEEAAAAAAAPAAGLAPEGASGAGWAARAGGGGGGGRLRQVATLAHPGSGRRLAVWADRPALQVEAGAGLAPPPFAGPEGGGGGAAAAAAGAQRHGVRLRPRLPPLAEEEEGEGGLAVADAGGLALRAGEGERVATTVFEFGGEGLGGGGGAGGVLCGAGGTPVMCEVCRCF